MKIDKSLLEGLLEQAKTSPRLRQNFDLRTTEHDSSQRMLNALQPGTQIPIHRHRDSTECIVILKGRVEEIFYNEKGVECDRILLDAASEYSRICVVPQGMWHTLIVLEPSVIFESKDGAYAPLTSQDVWNYE